MKREYREVASMFIPGMGGPGELIAVGRVYFGSAAADFANSPPRGCSSVHCRPARPIIVRRSINLHGCRRG